MDSPFQITGGNSKIVASGAATTLTAMPTKANGDPAKWVLVSAADDVAIAFGSASITANATDDCLIPAGALVAFNVAGSSHFACIQITAGAVVCVTALENQ